MRDTFRDWAGSLSGPPSCCLWGWEWGAALVQGSQEPLPSQPWVLVSDCHAEPVCGGYQGLHPTSVCLGEWGAEPTLWGSWGLCLCLRILPCEPHSVCCHRPKCQVGWALAGKACGGARAQALPHPLEVWSSISQLRTQVRGPGMQQGQSWRLPWVGLGWGLCLADTPTSLQTVEHGFPNQPSALAFDPELRIMAIGTRSGAVKMYPLGSWLMCGAPGRAPGGGCAAAALRQRLGDEGVHSCPSLQPVTSATLPLSQQL